MKEGGAPRGRVAPRCAGGFRTAADREGFPPSRTHPEDI